jgi:hypothetical protein
MPKILFICKKRQNNYGVSYGLINSCKFLSNALGKLGIETKVVSVIDNNFIDREVHNYKPTHVFIEAIWVVPEKFHVLLPKYPKVKWFVRLHSNTPFLANEGIAMQWIVKYDQIGKQYGNLQVSPNSDKLMDDLWVSRRMKTVWSPNVYFPDEYPSGGRYDKVKIEHGSDILNVGCFGAIRPMKNHLTQAMAAMGFANKINKTLHFHINGTRYEQNGEQVHQNLKYLFDGTKHKLVEHPWCDHSDFMLLVKEMDLGMQISFSETFNIVAADMVSGNIPLVGSNEISWLFTMYKASPNNVDDIILYLYAAYYGRAIKLHYLNKIGLDFYNYNAIKTWIKLLEK